VIDSDEQLRDITKWKKPKKRIPDRLGTLVESYMHQEVSPSYRQFSSVEQAWRQAIPDELAAHCRCDSISNGQLKVVVDSSAYMYKLQTMNDELIERLDQLCRRPKIRKIKFVPKA
jgi:predicted nucleic acid-binding Zn ribbon protein